MIMLKAGISRVDITPPKGLELAGYPHYPRYNEGFHDPLYATCMLLESNGTTVAMVTLDLLFFSQKHVIEVRRRVNARYGILGAVYSSAVFYHALTYIKRHGKHSRGGMAAVDLTLTHVYFLRSGRI
jgi:hypothetical protein